MGCEECPLVTGEESRSRFCLANDDYPIDMRVGPINVQITDEDELEDGLMEFNRQFYEARKRSGDEFHPRPFRRSTVRNGKLISICPHSWPTAPNHRIIIEQIVADTSGMQVRFFHNDLPWMQQPALYVDCFTTVGAARARVDEFLKQEKETARAAGKDKR